MNSRQLQSKLLVCSLSDASLHWPKELSSKEQRRGRRKQEGKQPLAKICLCKFNLVKGALRGVALKAKGFIYPQTDPRRAAVLHPAVLNVLVSPPERQAGSRRLRDRS